MGDSNEAPAKPGERIDASQLEAALQRVAAGDRDAMAEVYDATAPWIYGLCVKLLKDRAAADDVTAETYFKAWQSARDFDPSRGNVLAWLTTIARSRALDRLRSHARRQSLMESYAGDQPPKEPSACEEHPEQLIAGKQARSLINGALAELPAEQRRIVELSYFSGLSQSEIAQAIGQPLGTVKSRTRLAMTKLRDALTPLRGDL